MLRIYSKYHWILALFRLFQRVKIDRTGIIDNEVYVLRDGQATVEGFVENKSR